MSRLVCDLVPVPDGPDDDAPVVTVPVRSSGDLGPLAEPASVEPGRTYVPVLRVVECPHGDDACSFGSGACDCAR